MAEIIMIERSKISQLRTDAGQSKKKIENSAQEFFSTPESGRLGALMGLNPCCIGSSILTNG